MASPAPSPIAQVYWVEYELEGHGWYVPASRIDFWTRVKKFLGKHIGVGQ